MLQEVAFSDLRKYIKRRLAYARYRIDEIYYDTPISDIEITADGILRVKIQLSPGGVIVLNQMQLIDTENRVWASQDVQIALDVGQTHIMYWFDFNIIEQEVE